jgi:hypothetical protein
MAWLYPDRMHVRRLAKHFSDLKLDKAVLKTGDREGPAQHFSNSSLVPIPSGSAPGTPVMMTRSPIFIGRLHWY